MRLIDAQRAMRVLADHHILAVMASTFDESIPGGVSFDVIVQPSKQGDTGAGIDLTTLPQELWQAGFSTVLLPTGALSFELGAYGLANPDSDPSEPIEAVVEDADVVDDEAEPDGAAWVDDSVAWIDGGEAYGFPLRLGDVLFEASRDTVLRGMGPVVMSTVDADIAPTRLQPGGWMPDINPLKQRVLLVRFRTLGQPVAWNYYVVGIVWLAKMVGFPAPPDERARYIIDTMTEEVRSEL